MKNLIFPYDIIDEPLRLAIKEAVVSSGTGVYDEKPIQDYIYSQNKTINLWQMREKNWRSLKLRVVLSGTREQVEPFIQSNGPLTAHAAASCRGTKLRKSTILMKSATDPYSWEGGIEFDRREALGIVRVQGFITGKAAGRDFRFLAEADEWTVYLDEANLPQINGSLKVTWIDFASDPSYYYLQKFANEPYYVNLELPIPEVYLNKGLSGLPELFEYSRKGSRRAVHETVRTAVAKSVWMSLFQSAVDAITIGDEGEEPSLPSEEWQVSVLKQILPKVFPGYSLDAALKNVVQDMRTGDMRRIQTTAAAVIGKDIVHEGKAVRTAISELELDYGGDQ